MPLWLGIYLLVGLLYAIWLQVVNIIFKGKKNYIDPYRGKVTNQTAFMLGSIAAHIVAGLVWPLTIMWRAIEYEMLDQRVLFYEQQYDRLTEILTKLGVLDPEVVADDISQD